MFWNTRNAPSIGKRVHCWNTSNSTTSNAAFFAGSTWLWRAWLVHTFTSRFVGAVSLASNNVHYLNFSSVECVSFTSVSPKSSVARSLPLFAFALGRHRERKTTAEKEAFPSIHVAFEWKFRFGRDDGECLSKKFINWSRLSPHRLRESLPEAVWRGRVEEIILSTAQYWLCSGSWRDINIGRH